MKETVTRCMFMDRFIQSSNYSKNFSYEGLMALYDYFSEYEEDTGEEIELDVIGICCDFSEYEGLEEVNKNYDNKFYCLEDLKNETLVIEFDDGLIVQNF